MYTYNVSLKFSEMGAMKRGSTAPFDSLNLPLTVLKKNQQLVNLNLIPIRQASKVNIPEAQHKEHVYCLKVHLD